jgi:hypothetical protein
MNDFIANHNASAGSEGIEIAQNAFLACATGGSLISGPSHFDHRHMFNVPLHNGNLSAVFIASPFVPSTWFSDRTLAGIGVFTSGIANSAASQILRTTFHAGVFSIMMATYVSWRISHVCSLLIF